MKKIATIMVALMMLPALTAKAQEYKYEAKLGWYPIDLMDLLFMLGEYPDSGYTAGPVKTVGVFAADFDVKMKKWLTLGAKVSYRNTWRELSATIDGIEYTDVDRMQGFSVMPTVKFTTGYDSLFRYYATLGLGAGMDLSNGASDGFCAFQFTPVGIAIGKKLSWYFEMGLGQAYTGMLTGLSWRF